MPFAFDAVSFAASWVLLGRLRTDLSAPQNEGPRRNPRHDVAEGIRFILGWPYFRALATWSALANLLVNAMFFVAILRMVQDGVSPAVIGLVFTTAGVGGILGAIAAPWIIDRMPTGALVVTTAWSFVPLVVPMVLWNDPGRGRRRDLHRAAPQPGRQRRRAAPTGSRTPPPTSRAARRPPRSSCRCR